MESISLRFSGLGVNSGISLTLLVLGCLLLIIGTFLLKYWSAIDQEIPAPLWMASKRFCKLFLSVKYLQVSHPEQQFQAYLRTLSGNYASIVTSDSGLQKGAIIELDLSVLGHGPSHKLAGTRGRVLKKKSLGGRPETWLVEIRWIDERFIRSFDEIYNWLAHR